jgi:hypothetical protein
MLTILGSLLGFAGSAVPSVIDFFKDKEEKKQKTEELKLQIEAKKQGVDLDIKLFSAKKDFEEQKMLLAHDTALGNQKGFINSLRAFVRPFITYQAIKNGSDLNATLEVVWDEQTEGLFAAIISFWFGSRAMPAVKQTVASAPTPNAK